MKADDKKPITNGIVFGQFPPTNGNMAGESKKQLGLADAGMLKKIDGLFQCNVGHHVALPQIVVVGNQSSGKSSVLEGLTNLPFPKDSGLCTRFATQITFKRSPRSSTTVRVIPAKTASDDQATKCRSWTKTLDTLAQAEFTEIMTEVNQVMGISKESSPPKTFSEDVLSIEVNGPDQEHLSVIDVPGIFKKTTEGVTTKADMAMVNAMVESYVSNPRSIILAVVPANVDIATQEILDIAERNDPDGQRTLGVLTKPDLVDAGAEQMILDLLAGREHKLSLGWCILRNLGQRESQNAQDRNAVEKAFFASHEPWTKVERSKVGVEALRIRLGRLLVSHTRKEFPKVKKELEQILQSAQQELQKLGPQRGTSVEQQTYLIKIMSEFQSFTAMALDASFYADEKFATFPALRLANKVVNRNETFANDFERLGHDYAFKVTFSKADFQERPDGTPEKENAPAQQPKAAVPRDTFVTRKVKGDNPAISDLVDGPRKLLIPSSKGIARWLSNIHFNSRGFELGTFDPKLLAEAMRQQTSKWQDIARGYVSDIVVLTYGYVVKLLSLLCPDERLCAELLGHVHDKLMVGVMAALKQVDFLLEVERHLKPNTQNHYFNENLQGFRDDRTTSALDAAVVTTGGTKYVPRDEITTHSAMSNREHIVQDMHDILKAYYKVAMKRFIDGVMMQAVDYHLLSGSTSPLKVLSPELAGSLTTDELAQIAGEDELVRMRRLELKKTIDELERGKKILQSA